MVLDKTFNVSGMRYVWMYFLGLIEVFFITLFVNCTLIRWMLFDFDILPESWNCKDLTASTFLLTRMRTLETWEKNFLPLDWFCLFKVNFLLCVWGDGLAVTRLTPWHMLPFGHHWNINLRGSFCLRVWAGLAVTTFLPWHMLPFGHHDFFWTKGPTSGFDVTIFHPIQMKPGGQSLLILNFATFSPGEVVKLSTSYLERSALSVNMISISLLLPPSLSKLLGKLQCVKWSLLRHLIYLSNASWSLKISSFVNESSLSFELPTCDESNISVPLIWNVSCFVTPMGSNSCLWLRLILMLSCCLHILAT